MVVYIVEISDGESLHFLSEVEGVSVGWIRTCCIISPVLMNPVMYKGAL